MPEDRFVYHHWDGYPEALGKTLWDLYHGHFAGDLVRMLAVLIDEHPAGWSSIIQSDFSREPGYGRGPAPACYCHGERSETGKPLPLARAAASGCEFAYVFDPSTQTMTVLSSYTNGHKMIGMFGQGDPNAEWATLAELSLNGPEPDWKRLEGE